MEQKQEIQFCHHSKFICEHPCKYFGDTDFDLIYYPKQFHGLAHTRPWATRNPASPPPLGIFHGGIFRASEYGPIEIRLFAFKLLGLNMLKYAN